MHRAPSYLDTMIQGLLPGLQARKRREQRRMDVNNATCKGFEELALKNPHEAGEDDEICLRVRESLDIGPFGILVEFSAILSWSNVGVRESKSFRVLKNAGVGNITKDECDLRRNLACGA